MCEMATQLKNFAKVGKLIVGAAANYNSFLTVMNMGKPPHPIMFLKGSNTYITEGQNIKLPADFTDVIHETELGVIIGQTCKDVSEDEAMCYVGGYCLALDLTAMCALGNARSAGNPWTISKSFDTACPVSRFIEKAEVQDPHDLDIICRVNGEERINCNTCDLTYDIPALISYTSRYMTLEPNDLILTGSPPGMESLCRGDLIEACLGNHVKMIFEVC